MTAPRLITTKTELRRWREAQTGTLALVPTMGALHEGHARLLRAARAQADRLAVSIYVNPLQFGPGEDLERYPRQLDADLALCEAAGVDAVFAPTDAEMYDAARQVSVSAGTMGTVLEGASRPGHFDGVVTVVTKLFTLIRPDLAFFGLKDIQQFALISRLVVDLDLGVEIVGVPTVRDADGLALSSRNAYLSDRERDQALVLSRSLRRAESMAGARPSVIIDQVRTVLASEPGVQVLYAELVDFATFLPVDDSFVGRAVVALAARVGTTRLIDNVVLKVGPTSTATSARRSRPDPSG